MPSSSHATATTESVGHRAERVHGRERKETAPHAPGDEPPAEPSAEPSAEPTEGEGDGGDEEYEPI